MLGARNEEKGYVNALHNLNFNFNEDILMNGLKIYESLLKYKNSLVIDIYPLVFCINFSIYAKTTKKEGVFFYG